MDFPIAIRLFDNDIQLHLIAELLAFFIGFRYFLFLRKRSSDAINSNNRVLIIVGATLGAFVGCRLIGSLENIPDMMAAPNKWIYFYENKTVLGGFLGGLAGVELIKIVIGEKSSSGDLFTFPMILGLIIGRIGCFSMGVFEETYGVSTLLPWGMNLGDGVNRHPVTLYEIAFLVVLWIALIQLEKRYTLANGGRFKIFMMAYITFRFLLDFIKPHYTLAVGISVIQLTAAFGMLYYYRYFLNPSLLLKSNS